MIRESELAMVVCDFMVYIYLYLYYLDVTSEQTFLNIKGPALTIVVALCLSDSLQ